MLLAAGLGTRLRPLSGLLPKPLLPVGDRPVLAHVLDRLAQAGVERFVVNAHHLASDLERFVARAAQGDEPTLPAALRITVAREGELLGTAGGLAGAAAALGEGPVLVWNGDILAPIDVRAVLAASQRAPATLVVRPVALGAGNVGVDATGRVVRLRRETTAPGETQSAEFLGVHVIGPTLRARLPAQGCLVGDVYLPWLREGGTLAVHPHPGAFWDIGSVPSYLAANLAWLAARGERAWVHPSARVAPGIDLQRAVVGAGATVSGAGLLDEVVVWPGAEAHAPARRRVVATGVEVDVEATG